MADHSNFDPEAPGNDWEPGQFSYLSQYELDWAVSALQEGEDINPVDLAGSLRKYGNRPLPETVQTYICGIFDGTVKRSKGRPRMREDDPRKITMKQRDMIISAQYRRYRHWLQKRKAKYGHLEGWSGLKGADFWDGPPAVRAAKMAARRYFHGVHSWRSVQNINTALENEHFSVNESAADRQQGASKIIDNFGGTNGQTPARPESGDEARFLSQALCAQSSDS